MAAAHHGNAGFPQGGSLGLARSVEERYTSLGGTVSYRARTEKILVENDRAIGVELRGGRRYYAEHVVSACDGHTTIRGLLDGKYTGPRVDKLYDELLESPGTLFPAVVSAFVGVEGPLPEADAHSTTYLLGAEEAAALPGALQDSLVVQLRSRYSDGFAPPGKSVVHCTYFSDYTHWADLRRTDRSALPRGETPGRRLRPDLPRPPLARGGRADQAGGRRHPGDHPALHRQPQRLDPRLEGVLRRRRPRHAAWSARTGCGCPVWPGSPWPGSGWGWAA